MRDEHGRIVGRTSSVNPSWFQRMNESPDTAMSVKDTQQAIEKALAGEQLGVRQQRVVSAALDSITDERDSFARELMALREAARLSREQSFQQWLEATNVPVDAEFGTMMQPQSLGEQYVEAGYLPELAFESREVAELAELADTLGADWSKIDAAIELSDSDAQTQALIQLIWEQRNEHRQNREAFAEASSESEHVRAQLAHWKKNPPTPRSPDSASWKAREKALEDMKAANQKS